MDSFRAAVTWLYTWTKSLAAMPWAPWGLFAIAFAESSFFPVPPDVLLIAMALAQPKLAFWYALICSVGSVLGGCLGYAIGYYGGRPLAVRLFKPHRIASAEQLYAKYDIWAVAVAGFTPVPYKVFTITTGLLRAGFWRFVAASAASRSARFFLVSTLIYFFGAQAQELIEKRLDVAALVLVALGVGGFVAVKYLGRRRSAAGSAEVGAGGGAVPEDGSPPAPPAGPGGGSAPAPDWSRRAHDS